MNDQQQFESVGIVLGVEPGKFENSFKATLDTGDKLYGYKVKQDGTPAKVWPLIKESLGKEKPYRWTGNLKTTDNGSFRNVTFGFEIEGEPGSNGKGPAPEPGTWGEEPPPEAVPARTPPKPMQQSSKGSDDRNPSFAASYAKDLTVALVEGGFLNLDNATPYLLTTAEEIFGWLNEKQ